MKGMHHVARGTTLDCELLSLEWDQISPKSHPTKLRCCNPAFQSLTGSSRPYKSAQMPTYVVSSSPTVVDAAPPRAFGARTWPSRHKSGQTTLVNNLKGNLLAPFDLAARTLMTRHELFLSPSADKHSFCTASDSSEVVGARQEDVGLHRLPRHLSPIIARIW